MLARTQGHTYTRKKVEKITDLRELHPRGQARYEEHDIRERMAGHLHTHHLADATGRDYNHKKAKQRSGRKP